MSSNNNFINYKSIENGELYTSGIKNFENEACLIYCQEDVMNLSNSDCGKRIRLEKNKPFLILDKNFISPKNLYWRNLIKILFDGNKIGYIFDINNVLFKRYI